MPSRSWPTRRPPPGQRSPETAQGPELRPYLWAETAELYLTDLLVAETVDVLESFYEAPPEQVATAMRSLVSMRSVVTVDPALLLRAIEVYETDRLDFAEAYLVACAESTGIGRVASFDHSIDRVDTVERVEP